eukprot:m.89459 g.89459  ORF g.89459 m.89459 type:complete len:316 (+) comp13222_c0_seq1:137-1084(+)
MQRISFFIIFLLSTTMAMKQKTIREILRKPRPHWVGDGFHVFPVFADKAFTKELSPFLMFDYASPKHFPKTSKRLGVGQHPHRGFETVSIAFHGEIEHADNQGNRGVIKEGEVQWMTAARGIVHEEFHSTQFAKKGGLFEMCQLWVNLPAKHKMSPPRYQPITKSQIQETPLVPATGTTCTDDNSNDGTVRIIAGEFNGVKGPAETFTPVNMWDVNISTVDKLFEFDIISGHNTLVFVRRGAIDVQGSSLTLADVAILSLEGDKFFVEAKEKDTQLLILSGEPIDEPIANRGPFVMNTQEELVQAMRDYSAGRFT